MPLPALRRPPAVPSVNAAAILDFQSETAEVIGRIRVGSERRTVWVLSGMIALALVLAGFVHLDRVVTSPGQLVAIEGTFVIQPLENSLIKRIKVREGDVVQKGQVLATLDQTFTTADVTGLQQKIDSFKSEIARLTAERDGTQYEPEADNDYAKLQAQIFERRTQENAAQVHDYDQRMSSLQEQIAKSTQDSDYLRSRLKIQQDIEAMRTTLEKNQTGSRLNSLLAADSRLEVQRNLSAQEKQLAVSKHDLEALGAQRAVYLDHWRNQIVEELVKTQNSLDAAAAEIAKAQKRKDLVELQAPEDSIVLKIAKVSEGSVATAAEQLFTLVPLNATLEAEVRINARDLGFVEPGDHVELKLDAYRYLEHGTVKGTVQTVSSDSFTDKDDPRALTYYRSRIKFGEVHLRNVPENFRLVPGMPLQADIIVGSRTILSYLVEGALKSVHEGMREP